jgi:ABC-2 type transport system permease protein
MIGLLRADLLKLGKRPMGWAMLGISLLVTTAGLTLIAFLIGEKAQFPGLLSGPQLIAESLGVLFMLVFGATLIGSEYGYDTWKNLLTRRADRTPFILVKWLLLWIAISFSIVVLAVWSQVLVWGLHAAFDAGVVASPGVGSILLQLGLVAWNMAIVGSIGIFGAVVTRSTTGGVILGFVWTALDSLIGTIPQVPSWITGLLYAPSVRNLAAALNEQATSYSVVQSVIVLAIYLLVPIGAAVLIFRRRDMLS